MIETNLHVRHLTTTYDGLTDVVRHKIATAYLLGRLQERASDRGLAISVTDQDVYPAAWEWARQEDGTRPDLATFWGQTFGPYV